MPSTKQAAVDAVVALAEEAIAAYDALEEQRKTLRTDAEAAKKALRAFAPDHPLVAEETKPKAKAKSTTGFIPSDKLIGTVLDTLAGFDGREFTMREAYERIDEYSSSAVEAGIRHLRGQNRVMLSGQRGTSKTYQLIGGK